MSTRSGRNPAKLSKFEKTGRVRFPFPCNIMLRDVPMDVILLNREDMARTLERLAYQVLEKYASLDDVLLVGIQPRGVDLARRPGAILEGRAGHNIPLGTLDINRYRDDWTSLSAIPALGEWPTPVPVEKKHIILVDDVLFTGRTIRAALEAIADFGRPRKVELLALIDRGHRELPIHPDYTGKKIPTRRAERVDVLVNELDGRDEVVLRKGDA